MKDPIERRDAIGAVLKLTYADGAYGYADAKDLVDSIENLPSAQPQYEELTPEEAASEIASGSVMSVWYWLDDMTRLTQMGYAICKKR